jgi:hypothetical protein
MKLFLALLILLSAPLSVAQHVGCGQASAAATALAVDGEGAHLHQHGDAAADIAAEASGDTPGSCNLGCLSACATAAVPMSLIGPAQPAPAAGLIGTVVADLLNPHLPTLLRPPSRSAA